jgi:Pin2-interacting protein X1
MTAIKATQKLDMLGIGMQHRKDPNGIAWRQQQDFESLLRRLNDGTDAPGPFCKARAEEEGEEGSLLEGGEEKSTSETQKMDEDEGEGIIKKKEKKKKRKNAEEPDEVTHDKKRRKKRKKSKEDDGDGHDTESEPPPLPLPEAAPMDTIIAPTPLPIRAPYVARTYRASPDRS